MLREEWQQAFNQEFDRLYYKRLDRWLKHEEREGKIIYPPKADRFDAFNHCPPHRIKVVIVGQDPYHTPGFADGMAFSVPVDKGFPPSLNNIWKEIKTDLDISRPNHGNLTKWASQGVLLLNTCLSVEKGKPGSHRDKGWEQFTDRVISWLNVNKKGIVFMLWGLDAQKKESFISKERHMVLKSTHPSPFSAYVSTKGLIPFMGSKPFSQANKFLSQRDIRPIDWAIPNRV